MRSGECELRGYQDVAGSSITYAPVTANLGNSGATANHRAQQAATRDENIGARNWTSAEGLDARPRVIQHQSSQGVRLGLSRSYLVISR